MTQQSFETTLTNDEFAKWWEVQVNSGNISKYDKYEYQATWDDAWQAATAESNKRIAELRAHINLLREALDNSHKELLSVIDSVNQDKIHFDGDDFHETLNKNKKALSSIPKQSLQAYDNDVIERVVILLKDSAWDDGIIDMSVDDLIEDVRKLKEDEFPYSANLDIYNSVRFADAPYGTMIMESKIVKWLCTNRAKDYFDEMVEGK